MQVLPASLDQLDELAAMFDAYRVFYRKASDLSGAQHFLKERLAQKDSVIYIARDVEIGEATGFVQLYPLFSSTRMKRLWLLNDLFVKPEHRGKGISKQLINKAKDLARSTQAAGLLLETEITNTIGNQLYPSTDFELNKETNFYFWTNEGKEQ